MANMSTLGTLSPRLAFVSLQWIKRTALCGGAAVQRPPLVFRACGGSFSLNFKHPLLENSKATTKNSQKLIANAASKEQQLRAGLLSSASASNSFTFFMFRKTNR